MAARVLRQVEGRRPQRLRLSRRAGATLPETALSVAAPTPWQNPYRSGRHTIEAHTIAVDIFRAYLIDHPELVAKARAKLAGYDLACWCAGVLHTCPAMSTSG